MTTHTYYAGGGIGLGPRPAVAPANPYPVPEVTSRDGVAGPAKRAVDDLASLAGTLGWSVDVTYARGCFPHATTGRPGPVRGSLAVRMARGPLRAVAVYVEGSTWSWDTLTVQGSGAFPVKHSDLGHFMDGAFSPVQQPVKAAGPMLGPVARALKIWGPLKS
jgi:hypothetical protein